MPARVRRAAVIGAALLLASVLAPVDGAAAATPPAVGVIFSMFPRRVDISSSAQRVTVTLQVRADSPFANGCVYLGNPPDASSVYTQRCFSSSNRVQGDGYLGLYEVTLTIKRYAHTGPYAVTRVVLQDADGKIGVVSGLELALRGFDPVVHVTGHSDTTVPHLANLVVSPGEADLADGPAVFTLTARITDDLSGVALGCLNFGTPSSPTTAVGLVCMTKAERVAGDALDGTYRRTFTYDQNADIGAYPFITFEVRDGATNAEWLPAETFTASGFSTSFALTRTLTPPVSPTGVAATAQDRTAGVTWAAPTYNGGMPITGYTVTATPGGAAQHVDPAQRSAQFAGLTNGVFYRFTVHATNAIGDSPESAVSNTVVPDNGQVPTIALTRPNRTPTLSRSIGVAWSGSDESGIGHYEVRRRLTAWNAATGGSNSWLASTTTTSATYSGTYGRTYCFDARAADNAGNVSGWSSRRCTAVPLHSDQLTYSTGWSRVTRSGAYAGFGHLTTSHGAKVTRSGVVAKDIFLIATKSPSSGTVQVRWNGSVTKNVTLSGPTTLRKQVILVASFTTVHTGTLTVTVTSPSGKAVLVEGLAAYNAS